jgi:hypothetical protein
MVSFFAVCHGAITPSAKTDKGGITGIDRK